jgi:uncharacterized membrane protein
MVAILIALIYVFVSLMFSLGFLNFSLKLIRGESASYQDLFSVSPMQVFHYFIASILGGLAFVLGLILLIIPGIYLATRFSLFPYFIADQKVNALEALQKSWNATQGHVLYLLLFFLAMIGLNLLGLLALVVGLIITIPVSNLALGYVYNKMKTHAS